MRLAPTGWGFTVLLGALGALPPLGIDMGLPALPRIEQALNVSAAVAGQTLSLFLVGFALAQLGLGPLSDRVGRRPVLIGGLALYVLGGIGCAAAGSGSALVLWRLVQGSGAAAGTVMAYAIVRDLFDGNAARAKLSYVTMVLGVAPIVAPSLGGAVLLLVGWRGIYGFLALAGLPLLAAVALGLEESHRPDPRPGGVVGGYATVLRNRQAAGFSLANAASFGCMFAWIAGSPLVLIGALRLSATVYSLLFGCTAAAIMLGSWLSARLAARGVAARRPLAWALWAQFGAAVALVALVLAAPLSLAALMPLLAVTTFCRGLIGPNASHGAMEQLPRLAGSAAAVLGCSQMALGAVASGLVALLYPRCGPLAMVAVMLLMATLALVAGTRVIGTRVMGNRVAPSYEPGQ